MFRAVKDFTWPVLKPILTIIGVVFFFGLVIGILIAG